MSREHGASRVRTPRRRQRCLLCMGLLLLALGILANEWLLAAALSPDGSIDDPADLALIRGMQAALLLWGALNVALHRSLLAAKLNLTLVALCLVSPLLGELILRVGITAGSGGLRDPGLYADALSDDDYWKLDYLWSSSRSAVHPTTRKVPHELLGWAPNRTPDNPLGIVADAPYEVDPEEKAICFFGDSFVEGGASYADKIPQSLDRLLPERKVFNFGVDGYGLDQIYLRMKSAHAAWRRPFLLIGILTSDLDRSVLRFRGAPKPYFVVQQDSLALKGVPLMFDSNRWIERNPPEIRSYLCAFLQMRYRLHQPGIWREHSYKREQKIAINRAILREMTAYCRNKELAFCYVVFYEPDEFEQRGWREAFLLDELKQLGADVVDTKPVLQAAIANGGNVNEFYQSNHHLNDRGNKIIAEFIGGRIADGKASN